MRLFWIVLAALLLPGAAQAAWFEASSAHFVVYAEDSERDIRRFAEQLERYHEAMAVITRLEAPPPSPSNRVTVYVVRNAAAVQRLMAPAAMGGLFKALVLRTPALAPPPPFG